MAAGCLGGAVVFFALKGLKAFPKTKLPVICLISLPVMVSLLVALEFALDRTEISKLLLYILYVAVIICPCAMSLVLRHRLEKAAREGNG